MRSMSSSQAVATQLYRSLKGIFCVYKPNGEHTHVFMKKLKDKIANELNSYPLNQQQKSVIEDNLLYLDAHTVKALPQINPRPSTEQNQQALPSPSSVEESTKNALSHTSVQSLELEHTQQQSAVSPLRMAGGDLQYHPLACAIGTSAKKALSSIARSQPVKVYRATAKLGVTTDDFTEHGKILERASHKHITNDLIARVLAGTQAVYRRDQYRLAGLNLQSQEAYEAASKGLIRPKYQLPDQAVIYSLKCVEWQPPLLTIEIHTINENGRVLHHLIHNLGIELRCGAVCTKLRRIRYGHFDLEHSITHHQLSISNILSNIQTCRELEVKSLLHRAEQFSGEEYFSQLNAHAKNNS